MPEREDPLRPPEFMVPSTREEVLQRSFILNLQGIQDTLKRLETGQHGLSEDVTEVRENMIRMSAEEHGSKIKELVGRVNALERRDNQRDGASGMVSWLGANWPFLASLMVIVYIVLHATGGMPGPH